MSENICIRSGGAQAKRKDRMKHNLPQKIDGVLTFTSSKMLVYFFCRFKK